MAQGKLKVKSKLPDNVKRKQKKGTAVTHRANRPIQSKKKKFEDAHKLKQAITKTVNKAVEEDIRALASGGEKKLSKAQQAVVEHNSKNNK